MLDVHDFNERVIRGYEEGYGEKDLPADLAMARSLIPAGTATLRDFSYIAPDIPEYIPENCTGCMDCVTRVPRHGDPGQSDWRERVEAASWRRSPMRRIGRCSSQQWSKTRKYYDGPQKKGLPGGQFCDHHRSVSKCKGCAECVTVCDDNCAENDSEDRAGDGSNPQVPSDVQACRAVATSGTSTTTCSST